MSELTDDFKPYIDEFGLSCIDTKDGKGVTSQNGALFTAEYLIALLQGGKYAGSFTEVPRLRNVMNSLHCNGFSYRVPGGKEFDSMDNDIGLMCLGYMLCDNTYAKKHRLAGLNVVCNGVASSDDLRYLKLAKVISTLQRISWFKPKNYWNNQDPSKFCLFGWYGRSPGHMGLIDICATGSTTLFRGASLWVAQMLAIFSVKGNTDPWKLSYVSWYHLHDRGAMWRLGYKLWRRQLLKMYPRGMKDVYALYYRNENHPIVKWSKEAYE